jgi:hypothetical protein
MPPPAEAEEEGKNAKDKIVERLRRDNYYCGRDGRVPTGSGRFASCTWGYWYLTPDGVFEAVVNAFKRRKGP